MGRVPLSYLPLLRRWLSEEQLLTFPDKFYVILCDTLSVDLDGNQIEGVEYRRHTLLFLDGLEPTVIDEDKPNWSLLATFFNSRRKWTLAELEVHWKWWLRIYHSGDIGITAPSLLLDSSLVLFLYVYTEMCTSRYTRIVHVSHPVKSLNVISNEKLRKTYERLSIESLPREILRSVSVKDEVEAAVLLGVCAGIDVRKTNEDRIAIWELYRETDVILGSYERMVITDTNYTDWLSPQFYTNEQLVKLAKVQGVEIDGFEDRSELLVLVEDSFTYPNFYPGMCKDGKQNKLLISDIDVSEMDKDDILMSYGVLNNPETFRYVTVNEVKECWESTRDFNDPLQPKKLLSHRSFTKVQRLACGRLDGVVENIQFRKLQGYQSIEELTRKYTGNVSVIECLNKLIEAAFYMRNWIGPPIDVPLKEIGTASEMHTDVSVNTCIMNLREMDAYVLIKDLPLIIYKESKYKTSQDGDEGLTIDQRLAIIMDTESTRACLHLTSNWLLCSSHYYLIALGSNEPFDINELVLLRR